MIEKLFVNWQFFETYGVINYGSGWRKDVVNERLEFGLDGDLQQEASPEVPAA